MLTVVGHDRAAYGYKPASWVAAEYLGAGRTAQQDLGWQERVPVWLHSPDAEMVPAFPGRLTGTQWWVWGEMPQRSLPIDLPAYTESQWWAFDSFLWSCHLVDTDKIAIGRLEPLTTRGTITERHSSTEVIVELDENHDLTDGIYGVEFGVPRRERRGVTCTVTGNILSISGGVGDAFSNDHVDGSLSIRHYAEPTNIEHCWHPGMGLRVYSQTIGQSRPHYALVGSDRVISDVDDAVLTLSTTIRATLTAGTRPPGNTNTLQYYAGDPYYVRSTLPPQHTGTLTERAADGRSGVITFPAGHSFAAGDAVTVHYIFFTVVATTDTTISIDNSEDARTVTTVLPSVSTSVIVRLSPVPWYGNLSPIGVLPVRYSHRLVPPMEPGNTAAQLARTNGVGYQAAETDEVILKFNPAHAPGGFVLTARFALDRYREDGQIVQDDLLADGESLVVTLGKYAITYTRLDDDVPVNAQKLGVVIRREGTIYGRSQVGIGRLLSHQEVSLRLVQSSHFPDKMVLHPAATDTWHGVYVDPADLFTGEPEEWVVKIARGEGGSLKLVKVTATPHTNVPDLYLAQFLERVEHEGPPDWGEGWVAMRLGLSDSFMSPPAALPGGFYGGPYDLWVVFREFNATPLGIVSNRLQLELGTDDHPFIVGTGNTAIVRWGDNYAVTGDIFAVSGTTVTISSTGWPALGDLTSVTVQRPGYSVYQQSGGWSADVLPVFRGLTGQKSGWSSESSGQIMVDLPWVPSPGLLMDGTHTLNLRWGDGEVAYQRNGITANILWNYDWWEGVVEWSGGEGDPWPDDPPFECSLFETFTPAPLNTLGGERWYWHWSEGTHVIPKLEHCSHFVLPDTMQEKMPDTEGVSPWGFRATIEGHFFEEFNGTYLLTVRRVASPPASSDVTFWYIYQEFDEEDDLVAFVLARAEWMDSPWLIDLSARESFRNARFTVQRPGGSDCPYHKRHGTGQPACSDQLTMWKRFGDAVPFVSSSVSVFHMGELTPRWTHEHRITTTWPSGEIGYVKFTDTTGRLIAPVGCGCELYPLEGSTNLITFDEPPSTIQANIEFTDGEGAFVVTAFIYGTVLPPTGEEVKSLTFHHTVAEHSPDLKMTIECLDCPPE